jgi:hypothetical protein
VELLAPVPESRGVRMGRLFKIVSNGNIRLMIEIALQPAKQNPAYRFAAVIKYLFLENRKGYLLLIALIVEKSDDLRVRNREIGN